METKSNKIPFGNEAFFLYIGSASESISGLLIGMLLVRYFADKAVFATYSQSIFLAQTLVAFVPLGLHRAIMYFLPKVESKRSYVLQITILISLIIVIFGSCLVFLRQQIGSWFNNPGLTQTVPLVFGLLWMMNFNSILLQVLIGTKRSKLAGTLLTILSISNIFVVLIGTYLHFDVIQMLSILLLFHASKAILAFKYIFALSGKLKHISNFTHLSASLKYSLPLGLSSFTGMIGKTIDRFLIMSIFTPKVFAVYDRGATAIPFVGQIPYSIFGVLQPYLIEMYHKGEFKSFLEAWHDAVFHCARIMLPIMVCAWVTAENMIIILNTDAYLESVKFFRIYLFLLPLQLTVYPSILMAVGHTGKVFWVSTLYLVSNICLSIVFVKGFDMGPMGPAVATLVAELFRSLVFLYVIGKSLKIKFLRIYPWINLIRTSMIALFAGVLVYPLTKIEFALFQTQPVDLNKLLALIIVGSTYIFVYVFCGLLSRVITWEELIGIRKIISP